MAISAPKDLIGPYDLSLVVLAPMRPPFSDPALQNATSVVVNFVALDRHRSGNFTEATRCYRSF
jgi:hypothetical protein